MFQHTEMMLLLIRLIDVAKKDTWIAFIHLGVVKEQGNANLAIGFTHLQNHTGSAKKGQQSQTQQDRRSRNDHQGR